jgi:hypothetical protein
MSSATLTHRTVRYTCSAEIETLVRDFEACRIPPQDWTHHAHLTMALWYLSCRPSAQALALIRGGIQRYNRAKRDPNRPSTGYHETITLFWIAVLRQYLSRAGHRDLVSLANGLLDGWAHKDLPLDYYSKEVLFSEKARDKWVPPDLKPLHAGPAKAKIDWIGSPSHLCRRYIKGEFT